MFLIWVLFVLNPFANPYLLWFQFRSEMAQSYFPLRWESTGDQWWYVSPIDWAAANGHYDLVRELLYLDTNLLIKLTSLRRLRRLETVWDDDSRFENAAKCRSLVARNLLLECETKNHKNTLLRAGYGGWLLYTAASAGDVAFVKELLGREPLLVFGEGEYGVTDIFYAAARSKNSEVFRIVFEYASKPKGLVEGEREENVAIFWWEMANRAVHAAARGGNLEMMQEILSGDSSDVLNYRDVQGSTILHAASGRGQVEVVKYILTAFDIINSRDNEGNIALHIAAYRGHLSVVKTILFTCPSSSSLTNNAGDTFLNMAVAGFRTPGFHRLDSQMELMRQLVNGTIINIQEIINIRNDAGRTALHVAMIGNMHANLVEILMTARSINLNIRDVNGMTPLDLLGQRPRSASSEILIKQLVSAGGIFSSRDPSSISAIASQLKMQAIGSSPGTNFKISDAEIFLHAGIEVSEPSGRPSSCSSSAKSEIAHFGGTSSVRKQNYANRAANKLKVLLRWPRRKEKKLGDDDDSMGSLKKWSEREETPTPLRQRYSKSTSLLNHKRTLAVRSSMPSPVTKKKFTAGLMQGVIQAMPHLAPPPPSEPSGQSLSFDMFSRSGLSTPMSFEKQEFMGIEEEVPQASCSSTVVNGSPRKSKGVNNNNRAMNQYFCFGAQGLSVKDSVTGRRSGRLFKRSALRVA